jgi:hypothetical protein
MASFSTPRSPARSHRPPIRTRVVVKPVLDLGKLLPQSCRRHRNPDPDGKAGARCHGPRSAPLSLCGLRMHAGRRAELAVSQIAPGDLDVAVLGQLPATHLPLRDQFEPGPIEIIRFEASLGRRALVEETLEDAPGHPNNALVLTYPDAELDGRCVRVPWASGGNRKNIQTSCGRRMFT